MNSQRQNTNSSGDFVIKKPVLKVCFQAFWHTKLNPTQIGYDQFE